MAVMLTVLFQWGDDPSWIAFSTEFPDKESCLQTEQEYETRYKNGEFREWDLVASACETVPEGTEPSILPSE